MTTLFFNRYRNLNPADLSFLKNKGGTTMAEKKKVTPEAEPVVLTDAELVACGITPDLVRLSCGIEDIEDLIADIAQAMEQI